MDLMDKRIHQFAVTLKELRFWYWILFKLPCLVRRIWKSEIDLLKHITWVYCTYE